MNHFNDIDGIIKFLQTSGAQKIITKTSDRIEFTFNNKKYCIRYYGTTCDIYGPGYVGKIYPSSIYGYSEEIERFKEKLKLYEDKLQKRRIKKNFLQNRILETIRRKTSAQILLNKARSEDNIAHINLKIPYSRFGISFKNGELSYGVNLYKKFLVPRFENPNLDIDKVISTILMIIDRHQKLIQEINNCKSECIGMLEKLSKELSKGETNEED